MKFSVASRFFIILIQTLVFVIFAPGLQAETEMQSTSPTSNETSSSAENTAAVEKSPNWKGDAELGIVNTSGNTDTTTVKSKINAVRDNQPWRHTLTFESLSSDESGNTTAERYLLSGKSDFTFSKNNYMYGALRYEDDRFSGYDYQVTESVGYGRRLIDNPDLALDVETGPGARQSKLETGESNDELLWRLAGQLFWKISQYSEFTQSLSTEIGEDETISRSNTGLKSQVAERLAMKLSYSIKHTSDVPVGTKKTDTETIVTIVYSF